MNCAWRRGGGERIAGAWWSRLSGRPLAVRGAFEAQIGKAFFGVLAIGMSIWAIVSGWAGYDTLSSEKREGTLGFLFLTNLTGTDVVLGKLVSIALPAFGRRASPPLSALGRSE